ncbi:MAG: helix-turn-helix transcriptional regulator [Clostridia bacterium]|nr:helix-turn-helix transcriptional regulator [Clostridia bacterium]
MSMNLRYETRQQDISLGCSHNVQCAPHLHRDLELICLLEGEVIAYADAVRCTLHAGDVFLTFPNQIHSYEKLTPETHYCFIFKPDLVPEMKELFATGLPQSPVIRGAANDPRVRRILDALYETRDREPFAHLNDLRRGYLLALCSELLSRMTVSKLPSGDSETLRTFVSFCMQNYAENLSLSVLEEQLHLNKYYISHLFSGKLGLRFNDYINSLRISEACRYLLNSDYSITEIGSRVGFNTPRTFNRAFIKQMGVSPTEYRRERLPEIKTHIRNLKGQPRDAMPMDSAVQAPAPTMPTASDPGTRNDCALDGCEIDGCEIDGCCE